MQFDHVLDGRPTATATGGVWRNDIDGPRGGVATELSELLDSVHLLESAAIALGAPALTPEQLTGAQHINAELRVSGSGAAAQLARGFHQTLLCACSNNRMLELLGREVATATSCGAPFIADGAEIDRVTADHAAILEMIVAGAPISELERSLRQHAKHSPLCSGVLSGSSFVQ